MAIHTNIQSCDDKLYSPQIAKLKIKLNCVNSEHVQHYNFTHANHQNYLVIKKVSPKSRYFLFHLSLQPNKAEQ